MLELQIIDIYFFPCWTSGLVLSHSFAEYAVVSTLIDYLTGNWKKQHLPKAVAIIKLQDGVATVLAVVLAHVADSCIGRVNMIVFTTVSYVLVSPLLSSCAVESALVILMNMHLLLPLDPTKFAKKKVSFSFKKNKNSK